MFHSRNFGKSLSKVFLNKLSRNVTSIASEAAQSSSKESPVQGTSLVVEHTHRITLFGINKPRKKNCLDSTTAQALSNAIDEFESNDESLIGVIHGIGGTFCSGCDLEEISKCCVNSTEESDNLPHFGSLFTRKFLSTKPIIAAVSGYAVGMGLELALMCDLRVVEDTARMGFLNRRFGIPVMCGGTIRLPAMIGYSRAMDLILSGREITAEEAFNWGIANRLVAVGAALGQSVSLAQMIAKYPQRPLLADKAALNYSVFGGAPIDELLLFEKEGSTDYLLEEGVEGAARFVSGFGRHGKSTNLSQKDWTSFKKLSDDLV